MCAQRTAFAHQHSDGGHGKVHPVTVSSQRRYFPGLNALRAFAAFSVVFHHFGLWTLIALPTSPFTLTGYDAVTLFFVLSGFLITYEILEERQRTGDVSLKAFYWRRALRIYPLYFFAIALSWLLTPRSMTPSDTALSAIFMAEIANAPLGTITVLWSLGVEEKWYLVFPQLVKRFGSIPRIVAFVITLRVIVVITVYGLNADARIIDLVWRLRFDAMALGALGAWLVFSEHSALKVIYRLSPLVSVLFLIMVLFVDVALNPLYDFTAALLYMLLIINIGTNPHTRLCVENRLTHFLGKLSFGIYMYHTLILLLVGRAVTVERIVGILGPNLGSATVYVVLSLFLIIGGSIGLAWLSYCYVERPFLRMKERFASNQSKVFV